METELYRKGQDRVAEANKQALSGQVGGALTKEGIITQNGTTPITSQTLASTPSVKLPVVTPTSNPADAIIASTNQMSEDWKAEQASIKAVDERNAGVRAVTEQKEGVLTAIGKKYGLISDLQAQRAEAEKQVDPFRTELANINKEIADQNVALRGETDAIMARGDVSREGQQSLLQNVKDTYGRRLADLAIRQSAANQNVTALETALDRKLELATAPIKNDIEYFKNFELENLDILSKEERQRVQDIIVEKNKQLETVTKRETAIADVLKTASENKVAIPDNVVAQIQKAGSALEAYSILAKNGISLTKAGTGGSNQMTDNERALMTQFRGEQIVKDYNDILGQKGTIDAYIQNGVGGPADLALVFSFMKGLDPTSVVRESEYDTAAKSGNIFQGVFAKFNGYFKAKGGFLPENVKAEFQNLVNQKLAVKQKQYDNVKKNYEDIATRQQLNPQNVIIDYASGGTGTQVLSEEDQLRQKGYTEAQIKAIKEAK